MRLPNWLYAWLLYHSEKSMTYGLGWFLRPRFLILSVLLIALVWWAVVTLLRMIGILTPNLS